MEYGKSILLGIIISISFASIAISYSQNFASNLLDDKYSVTTNAFFDDYSSSKIVLFSVTFTNDGNIPINSFNATVLGCDNICNHDALVSTNPHTSETVSWPVLAVNLPPKNEHVVLNMTFGFEDGKNTLKKQKIR